MANTTTELVWALSTLAVLIFLAIVTNVATRYYERKNAPEEPTYCSECGRHIRKKETRGK